MKSVQIRRYTKTTGLIIYLRLSCIKPGQEVNFGPICFRGQCNQESTRFPSICKCWSSPEVQLFAGELLFNNTSCFDSRSQHVLLGGHVVRETDPVHFAEVAEGVRTNSKAIKICIYALCIYTMIILFMLLNAGKAAHYPAESFSWYSAALSYALCTPESFHSFLMTSDSSGGIVPSSMESDKFCSFCPSSYEFHAR